ncbi:MAG: hypothetical protein WD114_00985 [Phycisphaerales bacterium]
MDHQPLEPNPNYDQQGGPPQPRANPVPPATTDNRADEMVCVTLRRPPHFWRFACAPGETGDLLERMAEIADEAGTGLSWADAELIAAEIVIHHQLDTPSAGPSNDR